MICRKMNKSLPVFIAALTLHQVIHNRLVGELNEGRITEDEFARRMKDEAGISVPRGGLSLITSCSSPPRIGILC
jgi:hypothetical protein